MTAGSRTQEGHRRNKGRRCTSTLVVAVVLMFSALMIVFPQEVRASAWIETTDVDFADGDFLTGTAFQTVLHGTGTAAYVQNTKDMLNWTDKLPTSNPGPRTSFGFTNESYAGNFILFGGVDGLSSARNDTWEYDYASNDWIRICSDDTALCAPPRRSFPSMAYDNSTKLVVLYGGYASDFITQLSDTWEYDVMSKSWTNRTMVNRPRGLSSHEMTFDPVGGQMVLVGRGASSMEVWTYDTTTHAWTQKSPSGGPTLRSSFALAYNYQAGHRRVILFGGSEVMEVYQDTWEYDPQTDTWNELSITTKPPARADAAMTFVTRSTGNGIYLWGGQPYTNETWRFRWESVPPNPTQPIWQELFTPISPQPQRKGHGLAYDQIHDALVMFGGATSAGTRLNDTWALEFAYRLDGKYISSIFNTYTTITTWQNIFWNQTPAAVPPNTLIRFQVNVSNECDPGNMSKWFGPGQLTSTYYTTPGEVLGYSGFKCFRYLAEMITYNPSVAPKLEDVTTIYTTVDQPPKVVNVYPNGFNVPLTAPFYINFSKPMDTSNVWIGVRPNVTLDTPWTWEMGNTELTITHNGQSFLPGTKYDVCVWGTDTFGVALDYPDNKYCWSFTSRAFPPKIIRTDPSQGQLNVPITTNIVFEFDKPMNTSTCWPFVIINPDTNYNHVWNSPLDTILTLTPTAPLIQLEVYEVELPIGNLSKPCLGKDGLEMTVGPVPNPFSFTTEALNPYIVETTPMDYHPLFPVNSPVAVNFSRPMNKASLVFVCKNLATGENCSMVFSGFWPNNMTITISHTTPFGYCTPYKLQVWALDSTGKSLIHNPAAPNPWRFMAGGLGGSCPPYMIFTDPFDGETEVPIEKDITISFMVFPMGHGELQTNTFIFSIKDEWGNELNRDGHFTIVWNGPGHEMPVLTHPMFPFNRCMHYTVTVIDIKDIQGRSLIPGLVPNPFHFSTVSTDCQPILIWEYPPDKAWNVSIAQPISMKFSIPINTSTFMFNMFPSAEPYNYDWGENDTNVTITHTDFIPCQDYTAMGNARGKNGQPLNRGPVPNPWTFSVECTEGPKIIRTDPAHGQLDVPSMAPIHIDFSEPMNTSWALLSLSPMAGSHSYNWTNDTHLVVYHSLPFYDNTMYTAWARARNVSGGELVAGPVPNPWRFRSGDVPPFIVQTDPYDGEIVVGVGEPITVEFSEAINPTSFIFELTPSLGAPFTPYWPNNRTVRLSHVQSFQPCTRYQARVVQAKDMTGNALVPGPVPNPWNFTSDCSYQIKRLRVIRAPPNDVYLEWVGLPEAQYYKVFTSNDRLRPFWMWTQIANITTPFAIINGHLSDMGTHFYIVRGYGQFGVTSNSTMGVLWHLNIFLPPGGSGTCWFSLPYNTIYKKASDITKELGPTNITVVGKWDPARQQSILYYYLHGMWRGTDFKIDAGDGLWLGVVNTFSWAVNGTDRALVMDFVYRPIIVNNLYWIGLPFTGRQGNASQLVLAIEGNLGPGSNLRIKAVGKWNFFRQTSDVFEYTPVGWCGTDFQILPGDGIWVRITSTFSWSPDLITPEIT